MGDERCRIGRRRFLVGVGTAAGLASATGVGSAQSSGTHTVEMTDDLVFDPDEVTVSVGDTVVWENVGVVGHTVTAYADRIPADADYFASGGFDAEEAARSGYPDGDVPGGETYEHTFEVPGTYEYFCVPHEAADMVGTVVVEPGGGAGDRPDEPREPSGGAPVLPAGHPASLAVVVGSVFVALIGTFYALANRDGTGR